MQTQNIRLAKQQLAADNEWSSTHILLYFENKNIYFRTF